MSNLNNNPVPINKKRSVTATIFIIFAVVITVLLVVMLINIFTNTKEVKVDEPVLVNANANDKFFVLNGKKMDNPLVYIHSYDDDKVRTKVTLYDFDLNQLETSPGDRGFVYKISLEKKYYVAITSIEAAGNSYLAISSYSNIEKDNVIQYNKSYHTVLFEYQSLSDEKLYIEVSETAVADDFRYGFANQEYKEIDFDGYHEDSTVYSVEKNKNYYIMIRIPIDFIGKIELKSLN